MQAGHEKTMTALLPALAGANMIYGLGMVDMGMTLDFGQIVADNEFATMIKRLFLGIPVNDEELAVDLIKKVGAGGNFLTEMHTMNFMRRSQWYPEMIDRNVYAHWKEEGATDLAKRVNEEAKRILETHEPEPLPDDTLKLLREIIDEAEKREGVR
jgi:trimethylamine--corrinoid protein Co-methyltransferase